MSFEFTDSEINFSLDINVNIKRSCSDATKISVAMASWNKSPRLALLKDSPFLPSLSLINVGV